MAKFYHMRNIENLSVVSCDEDGYMLWVELKEGAEPEEPSGLLNSFVVMTSANGGFPVTFGYDRKIVANVDATRSSLEDVVNFFNNVFKK